METLFKIGIFGKTEERALAALEKYLEKVGYEQIKRRSRGECELKGGMKIMAFTPQAERSRGRKFDEIIYDDEMSGDEKFYVAATYLSEPLKSFSSVGLDL